MLWYFINEFEMSNYSELLKDQRWELKRKEILKRDNYTCQCCGVKNKELHVHHSFYIDGEDPWDHKNHILITLCPDCHRNEENEKQMDSVWTERFLSLMLLRSDISALFWAVLKRVSPMDDFNILPSAARERFKKIISEIKGEF